MDKEANLEEAGTVIAIIALCIQIADFCANHKDEIKALIKKGWTDAHKIVDYIRKKYHYK
jgi:hypothetical protein